MDKPSTRPIGRAKACLGCRQDKLKCDARQTLPDPCSRCVREGRNCRFSPTFQRISTRKVGQEISSKIHGIKSVSHSTLTSSIPQAQAALPPLVPDHGIALQTPAEDILSTSNRARYKSYIRAEKWLTLQDEIVHDQELGGRLIDASTISQLFHFFERFFYPHVPFVRKVVALNHLAQTETFFFLTVLVCSSSRIEGGQDLHAHLCGVHDSMIGNILRISIQSLETVHALMLLATWPIVRDRNAYDPSLDYIALATSAAMNLDCHHPDSRSVGRNFRGPKDTTPAMMDEHDQALTWLFCFLIGTRLSIFKGAPPLLSALQHAQSLKRAKRLLAYSDATPLLTLVELYEIYTIYIAQFDAVENVTAAYTTISAFDRVVESVRSRLREHFSPDLAAEYHSIKLSIYHLIFTLPIPPESFEAVQAQIYRDSISDKCVSSASALISAMTKLSQTPIEGTNYTSGVLSFYPKHYFTSLWRAATSVFRYLISRQALTPDQTQVAFQNLIDAHRIFQSFVDHRDAIRGAIHIELMVDVIRAGSQAETPPVDRLAITNRLGDSVSQDAGFRTAWQNNRNSHSGSPPPASNWTSMNASMSHRLPLTPELKRASASPDSHTNTLEVDANMQADINANLTSWDNYYYDFGVGNEAWAMLDTEFQNVFGMTNE